VSSRAVRRSTSAAALSTGATGVATSGVVVVEESEEPTMVRIALIATAFILLLALPVAVSSASGNLSSLAQSIAGIFSSGLSDG
jgi:hypothetical protein